VEEDALVDGRQVEHCAHLLTGQSLDVTQRYDLLLAVRQGGDGAAALRAGAWFGSMAQTLMQLVGL